MTGPPFPWKPVSLPARRIEVAHQGRLAKLRQPRRVRGFELTEAGVLLTHASTR